MPFFPKNWNGILRPAINEWRPKKKNEAPEYQCNAEDNKYLFHEMMAPKSPIDEYLYSRVGSCLVNHFKCKSYPRAPWNIHPVIYAKSSRKVQTTLQLGLHSIAQSIGSPAKSISKTKKLLSFQYNALLDKLTLWLNIWFCPVFVPFKYVLVKWVLS